ncbi:MAG: hypothetical protein M3Y64_03355, partial [Gemmatimonadota bacterium]|nr:hypothetical protein [Gemmatimonadota bacterium]
MKPINSANAVSRRDFLSLAGKAGLALSVLDTAPGAAQPAPAPPARIAAAGGANDLANGILGANVPGVTQAPYAPSLFSGLKWRDLGPFRGGRVASASGVPGRPNEFYFGSVNGGLWKSIDAGRVWTPVFDSQPVASIGAIAVARSASD